MYTNIRILQEGDELEIEHSRKVYHMIRKKFIINDCSGTFIPPLAPCFLMSFVCFIFSSFNSFQSVPFWPGIVRGSRKRKVKGRGSAVPLGSGCVPDGDTSSASVTAEARAELRLGNPRVNVGDDRKIDKSCRGRDITLIYSSLGGAGWRTHSQPLLIVITKISSLLVT
jgi:hypothetical protein